MFLGEQFSPINAVGLCVLIVGVVLFNWTKYRKMRRDRPPERLSSSKAPSHGLHLGDLKRLSGSIGTAQADSPVPVQSPSSRRYPAAAAAGAAALLAKEEQGSSGSAAMPAHARLRQAAQMWWAADQDALAGGRCSCGPDLCHQLGLCAPPRAERRPPDPQAWQQCGVRPCVCVPVATSFCLRRCGSSVPVNCTDDVFLALRCVCRCAADLSREMPAPVWMQHVLGCMPRNDSKCSKEAARPPADLITC